MDDGVTLVRAGLSLAIITGVLVALAWTLRRTPKLRAPIALLGARISGRDASVAEGRSLSRRGHLSVGPGYSVVLVAWGGRDFLLGIGGGPPTLLATFERDDPAVPSPSRGHENGAVRISAGP